jgi:hypothetical protein
MPELSTLPLLRSRNGDQDEIFEHPITVIGTVGRVDFDTVTMLQGPSHHEVELYVEDLAQIFGHDEDLTVSLFVDAAEHGDHVTITLAPTKLSYDNHAQLKRLEPKPAT